MSSRRPLCSETEYSRLERICPDPVRRFCFHPVLYPFSVAADGGLSWAKSSSFCSRISPAGFGSSFCVVSIDFRAEMTRQIRRTIVLILASRVLLLLLLLTPYWLVTRWRPDKCPTINVPATPNIACLPLYPLSPGDTAGGQRHTLQTFSLSRLPICNKIK